MSTTLPETADQERRAFLVNGIAVVVVGLMALLPYFLLGSSSPRMAAALVTGLLMWAGLLWRRRNPLLMLALVTAGGILQLFLLNVPTTSVVVIPVAVYSYARWVDGRRSRLVLLLGAAAAVLGPLSWVAGMMSPYTDFTATLTFYVLAAVVCGGMVVTPYAIGRRIRESALITDQRAQARVQRHQAELAEREAAARFAEVRARSQIARELHDIVAHSLSVMIVQAEGGRALAAKRPEHAAEVLGTIAETGRDALAEMRRIVGVLRGEDPAAPDYRPTPGLDDIPEMVERSGDRVALVVRGAVPSVPQTVGLTAYRIAQEGVTNFLKHAGPEARCQVTVSYLPDMIVVEVADDGVGAASSDDGAGHGLQGMAERVAAMGGQLLARPRSTGGFLVRALLPMPPAGSSPANSHPAPPFQTPAPPNVPTIPGGPR
nr:histidine kinase [Aestuariimicrobium ganziense]